MNLKGYVDLCNQLLQIVLIELVKQMVAKMYIAFD